MVTVGSGSGVESGFGIGGKLPLHGSGTLVLRDIGRRAPEESGYKLRLPMTIVAPVTHEALGVDDHLILPSVRRYIMLQ